MQQKLHAQKNKLQRIKELHRKKKNCNANKIAAQTELQHKNYNAKITAMHKTATLKNCNAEKIATPNKKQAAAQTKCSAKRIAAQ